ncbi:MAG TPA: ATP-binding protein [Polyangiales bacterium]|nr:ATP-binding protein [Polyangiales bacterium]
MSTPTPAEERILVLAPTGRDAPLTCTLLQKAGLDCAVCSTLPELCQLFASEGAAALLIAEEVFATSALTDLSEALSKQASWSDIPVLIFTGKTASLRAQRATSELLSSLGNVTLLERPLRPVTMISAARAALRARRRQYMARTELYAQLRAVRERDQFLAMLGHELRNPLSAIAMAIELGGDSQSKHVAILRRQTKHLTRLVDDLLDVARVTSGKIVLRPERLDLRAALQRCLNALPPDATREITLRELPQDAPVWVHADPVRLEQVITNLLNNALKYTGAGGMVEVSASVEQREAVLRVRDTGVGLAPEMVEHVFDLFTQVEDTLDRAKGGMGIGLTLVRSLVTLHGGTVTAHSPGLGKGSLFTVRLPLSAASVSGLKHSSPEDRGTRAVGRQACDVLIVEDNRDTRELLSLSLERRGHRVFTAEDGPSGVAEALSHRPRVLLVDIGLPGLDGYGVARQVRASLGRSVYMVAITGYGQPDDRRRALEAGFDLHLIKPLDMGVLDGVLAREVERLAN